MGNIKQLIDDLDFLIEETIIFPDDMDFDFEQFIEEKSAMEAELGYSY